MPRSAPIRARLPAVDPVRVRRVLAVAPVAVSVRNSLADSARMRPTVIARTPRASRMPATDASVPSWEALWRSAAFTVGPAPAAGLGAPLILAGGVRRGGSVSHPGPIRCRPSAAIAGGATRATRPGVYVG